jgi:hypothetical protein
MAFALRVESPMLVRVAVVAGTCVLGAIAAKAEELGPEQARAFVVGKLFSYTCFDGTAGMGRIFADGSVVGTIRPGGRGEVRFANLPPGTLRVEGSSMCAHLSGMIMQPCFRVEKIDYRRFRGSISGLGFAYCDFYQHNPRAEMMSRLPGRTAHRAAGAAADVTAIPDDVVLDIAITQLHGIVVGNDLLVIADAAAQIANPGREAHLWNWRLVGTGPYKRVGDLSDLTFRLLIRVIEFLAKRLAAGVL